MSSDLHVALSAALDGLGALFKVGVACCVFTIGKHLAKEIQPKWKCILYLLAGAAFLAALGASSLGSHTEDGDPLFGGGETVEDFAVSDTQRFAWGVKLFVMTGVLFVLGAVQYYREHPFTEKKAEEDQTLSG